MARLPIPGSDNGQWGTVLNDYLSQTLDATGALNAGVVGTAQVADGSITEVKLDGPTQAKINSVAPVTSVAGKIGAVTLVKADVGLSNVDDTSDANKPISSATQTALNAKAATSHTHAAGDITSGFIGDGRLGTGTASSTRVLVGDRTWARAALLSINAQTGTSYQFISSDDAKLVTLTNASPITLTVPNDSTFDFPIGTFIKIAQMGAGQVTITPAGGVTVNADPGLKIAAQYGGAELIKLAANTWLAVGRLEA